MSSHMHDLERQVADGVREEAARRGGGKGGAEGGHPTVRAGQPTIETPLSWKAASAVQKQCLLCLCAEDRDSGDKLCLCDHRGLMEARDQQKSLRAQRQAATAAQDRDDFQRVLKEARRQEAETKRLVR